MAHADSLCRTTGANKRRRSPAACRAGGFCSDINETLALLCVYVYTEPDSGIYHPADSYLRSLIQSERKKNTTRVDGRPVNAGYGVCQSSIGLTKVCACLCVRVCLCVETCDVIREPVLRSMIRVAHFRSMHARDVESIGL